MIIKHFFRIYFVDIFRFSLFGINILPREFMVNFANVVRRPHPPSRWTDPRISEWLSGILDLPVVVENDASAAAVGEHSRIEPLHRSVSSYDALLGNRVIIGSSGSDTRV